MPSGTRPNKEVKEAREKDAARRDANSRDTSNAPGGGLGRSRGGLTGNSETATKNREKAGAPDPTGQGRAPDSTAPNMLDKMLGYENLGQRRAAYKNNPNRPGYDTKTMGVPIDMPMEDVPFGGSFSPMSAFTTALGFGNIVGSGMMATRAIQSMTGMSGGPAVGGMEDGGIGGKARTRGTGGRDGSLGPVANKPKSAVVAGEVPAPVAEAPKPQVMAPAYSSNAGSGLEGSLVPLTDLEKMQKSRMLASRSLLGGLSLLG